MEGSNEAYVWRDCPNSATAAKEEAELRVATREGDSPVDEVHQDALAAARRNVGRFISNASLLARTPEVVSLPPLPDDPAAAT